MLLLDEEYRDLEPFKGRQLFSTGWMISRTFSYRFSTVIDKASSPFFAASPRVVVSRFRMISRALWTSSWGVFLSRDASICAWRAGSSAATMSVEMIALILRSTSETLSSSSSLT